MPLGSKARTVAPSWTSRVMIGIDGASRMSSVSGLNVSPNTAPQAPAQGGIAVERGEVAEQLAGADEQHGVTVDEGLMGGSFRYAVGRHRVYPYRSRHRTRDRRLSAR
jgi:hypothetical protein